MMPWDGYPRSTETVKKDMKLNIGNDHMDIDVTINERSLMHTVKPLSG
jgi:hypothetical protein